MCVCVCAYVCVCVPLRAFLVYFMNRHQHNVTIRPSEKEVGKVIKFKDKIFLFYFNKICK